MHNNQNQKLNSAISFSSKIGIPPILITHGDKLRNKIPAMTHSILKIRENLSDKIIDFTYYSITYPNYNANTIKSDFYKKNE